MHITQLVLLKAKLHPRLLQYNHTLISSVSLIIYKAVYHGVFLVLPVKRRRHPFNLSERTAEGMNAFEPA